MQPSADITIRIDELIVEGIAAAEWRRVEDTLQREMERLIEREGLPETVASSARVDSLDAGDLELRPGLAPTEIGRRLARLLYDQLVEGGR